MSNKVMAAMSGGVDSSAAAVLLLDKGYAVTGATLKLFSNDNISPVETGRTCCALSDVEDARTVAYKLKIEHFVFNFADQFKTDVIQRFADAYIAGNTPNPCIDCNRYIKFDKLLERAILLGMDYVATGHYANIAFDAQTGRYLLKKSTDTSKDQTYVLYSLTQEQLKRTLFPLGGLLKTEVRALAESRGLVNAKKPDSQDICFVPDGDYAAFLKQVLGIVSPPGDFVDSSGRVLGTHKGLVHYTIGQRKGLNLSFDRPKYVVRKDTSSNTVVIGDESELFGDQMTVEDVNLISIAALTEPLRATVKTRYSQQAAPATLFPADQNRITVRFDQPQRAITPGQAAVFYSDELVIGGGTIV